MSTKIEDQELEIDVIELFKLLWDNILVILLSATVTCMVFLAVTMFLIEPKYKAEASMYVNNSSFSFGQTSFSISSSELSASNSLAKTYIYILETRETLEEVIKKLDLDYTYEKLKRMITTEEISGTAIFKVTVKSNNPVEAERIANGIVELLPERIEEIIDGSTVRTVSYAIVPAHRSSPVYWVWDLAGFIIGALVSSLVVVICSLNKKRDNVMIGTAGDLRKRYPDITVLSIIPDMRLSNKKGYYYSSYYSETKKGE